MNMSWLSRVVMAVAAVFLLATFTEFLTPDAEARAGRGRSSGRSSFGSNKQSQNQQPANQNNGFNQNTPGAGNPAMNNRGGMMRNIAGGMAGGFLGSMLFSSMGNAAGVNGAAGGGGIGMLEILLIAGLAYFGFRWWKSRQQTQAYAGTNAYRMAGQNNHQQYGSNARSFDVGSSAGIDTKRFLAFAGEAIDQEHASDILLGPDAISLQSKT